MPMLCQFSFSSQFPVIDSHTSLRPPSNLGPPESPVHAGACLLLESTPKLTLISESGYAWLVMPVSLLCFLLLLLHWEKIILCSCVMGMETLMIRTMFMLQNEKLASTYFIFEHWEIKKDRVQFKVSEEQVTPADKKFKGEESQARNTIQCPPPFILQNSTPQRESVWGRGCCEVNRARPHNLLASRDPSKRDP